MPTILLVHRWKRVVPYAWTGGRPLAEKVTDLLGSATAGARTFPTGGQSTRYSRIHQSLTKKLCLTSEVGDVEINDKRASRSLESS